MRQLFSETWKSDAVKTVILVFISTILYFAFKSPKLDPDIAEVIRSFILLSAGIIATILWSSADRTRRMTFKRLADLIIGADAAGLERVEPTLERGTRAEDACKEATRSIKFIGVGGRKFLSKILADSDGNGIGRRIASGNVSLDVMLLDPRGAQIKKWTRNEKKLAKVEKDICLTLKEIHPVCIKSDSVRCRIYDFMPPLRILIVDNDKVFVSRYDPASSDGWDAPQLCFVNYPETKSSEFTKSFEDLFAMFWDVGHDLESRHYV